MASLKCNIRPVESYSRERTVTPSIPLRVSTNFSKDFRVNHSSTKNRGQHKASVARFLNWFAYYRKYSLGPESLKRCPLVNCPVPGEFQSEREMMNHLHNCPQLQNGSYECSHCNKEVKIRRFHGNTCQETCKERIVSAITRSPLTRLLSPRTSKRHNSDRISPIELGNPEASFSQALYPSPMQPEIQFKWFSGDELTAELASERLSESGHIFETHRVAGPSELASTQLVELDSYWQPSELHGTIPEPDLGHYHQQSEPPYRTQLSYPPSELSASPSMDTRIDGQLSDPQKTTFGMTFIGGQQPRYPCPTGNVQFMNKLHKSPVAPPLRSPFHGRSESSSSTESSSTSGTMATSSTASGDLPSSLATTPSSDIPPHTGMMRSYQLGLNEHTSSIPLNAWLADNPDDHWRVKILQSSPSLEYQFPVYEQGEFVEMTPVSAFDPHGAFKTGFASQINFSYEHDKVYSHSTQPSNQLSPRVQKPIPIFMEAEKSFSNPVKPENPYTCICGFEFQGKEPNKISNLKRHQETCPALLNNLPAPKKFKCNFPGCEKRYTRSDNLLVHKRGKNHMTEVTFEDLNETSFLDDPADSSFDNSDVMDLNHSGGPFFDNTADINFDERD